MTTSRRRSDDNDSDSYGRMESVLNFGVKDGTPNAFVFMYVHMYMYVNVCVCTDVCKHMYVCNYLYVYLSVCMHWHVVCACMA